MSENPGSNVVVKYVGDASGRVAVAKTLNGDPGYNEKKRNDGNQYDLR